jgi:hypothetical protein
MARVGPPMYSVPHHPQMPTSFPFPITLTLPPRRHALPHVFRLNGCWSSFRLLLFAFRRFRSFPRSLPVTVLSPRTSSNPFPRSSPRCAHSNSTSCGAPLVRASLVNLFSHALNVSLLRYIAFVFRLLVCLVPSHGGHGHVYQKASRAKPKIYSHNILRPRPPSPPLYHTPPSPRPSPIILSVADCLFISLIVNCCDFSCTGLHHILGRRTSSTTPWAWNNRRKHYSKHISLVAPPTFPPPPLRRRNIRPP